MLMESRNCPPPPYLVAEEKEESLRFIRGTSVGDEKIYALKGEERSAERVEMAPFVLC